MTEDMPPPAGGEGPTFGQSLQGLLHELSGVVSDRVHLLALELRRAGQALAEVVALVVALGVLAVTAWLALWAGLVAAAIRAGVPWGWVLVGVLALNAGAAYAAWLRVRGLLRLLTLPATVRRLTVTHGERKPLAEKTAAVTHHSSQPSHHEYPSTHQPVGAPVIH